MNSIKVEYAYLTPFAANIVQTVNDLRREISEEPQYREDESRFTTIWA